MKIALILQGGGARGIYTSAILDMFLTDKIHIDKIFAVSAGALNALNYLSNQKGRSKKAFKYTFKLKEFASFKNIIKKKTFVDFDYYFNEVSKTIPFDFDTYTNSPIDLTVVATCIETGKPAYFNKSEFKDFIECVKASSSLPMVSKPVEINFLHYQDGGDSDPLPFKKAIQEGYDRVIVITTRKLSYRKKTTHNKERMLTYKLFYKNYPRYMKALKISHQNYNKEFSFLMKEKNIFIIEPSESIKLKHLDKNDEKIDYYYNLGLKDYEKIKEKLAKYLS